MNWKIRMEGGSTEYFLGIDLGTTSVKACVIDKNGKVLSHAVETHGGQDDNKLEQHCQSVFTIMESLEKCLSIMNETLMRGVRRIGICGQMHGVCMWKYESPSRNYRNRDISSLYTWMDKRCTSEYLASLPQPQSHLKLSSGHGCATLFWFQRFLPNELLKYDSAGTIMDFLVTVLCDLSKPVISTQNGASWGYFDTIENSFNTEILENANFPTRLLPIVLPPNKVAGFLKFPYYGLKPGTPVGVALGDLQSSVYGLLASESATRNAFQGFLNISTSAQIGYVSPKLELNHKRGPGIEYFPYFNSSYLAVGASLNGGNVLATFVQSLQSLLETFGLTISKDDIWRTLLKEGSSADQNLASLSVSPQLFGERHLPEATASIMNITSKNHSLGHFFQALCQGLVDNLAQFISPEQFLEVGVEAIQATGSALLQNPVLQEKLSLCFKNIRLIYNTKDLGAEFGVAEYNRNEYFQLMNA